MTPDDHDLLMALMAQPTAPFREARVRAFAQDLLRAAGVPHFLDPLGNLVVGAASPAGYQRLLATRSREPVRLFIAHMDHPGFHGVRWLAPGVLRVRWHGGSPTRHLTGAPVWLADDTGGEVTGVLRRVRLGKHGLAIDTAEVHLDTPAWRPRAQTVYGAFRFRKPVWRSGARLYARAADDLVGVFCVLATALEAFRARRRPPFLGLLSRAEEVGLVGTVAHLQLGWLANAARPVVAVSLEASRTLPGAELGKGPIVRLGDRRTPFSAGPTQVVAELAAKRLPGRHQRRLMDGGSCEGSAAVAWGLPTLALAVPLGNYHNQGLQGGPDCRAPLGPAPEFVHRDDVAGMRLLCAALLEPGLSWCDPWREVRTRLAAIRAKYDALLTQSDAGPKR
ncbi:hypothetical protein [Thiobacter aerophilum]|uniref:Uncharacterized protein n=1 Tax=Thiobacter aerophilum TaxID=3121275 RepID=A0ABV0EFQ7_9BURK